MYASWNDVPLLNTPKALHCFGQTERRETERVRKEKLTFNGLIHKVKGSWGPMVYLQPADTSPISVSNSNTLMRPVLNSKLASFIITALKNTEKDDNIHLSG